MKDISHKVLMLRPMRAGASGFARLHRQGRYVSVQIRVRGVGQEGFQAYWHDGSGADLPLGGAICDPRGEATLTADLPEGCSLSPGRLQALLLVENKQQPGPLMIGLWADASAGSMMDTRNACLALCDRLRVRPARQEPEPPPVDDPPPASPEPSPQEKPPEETPPLPLEDIRRALAQVDVPRPQPPRREPVVLLLTEEKPAPPPDPPREIFLTAIDPLPYVEASERPQVTTAPAPAEQPSRQPVDALPELRWPKAFQPLREHFQRYLPTGLFPLPGWRFVCVSRQGDGLWIGRKAEDGAVTRVAYVMEGDASGEYQPLRGADGKMYRALVQKEK